MNLFEGRHRGGASACINYPQQPDPPPFDHDPLAVAQVVFAPEHCMILVRHRGQWLEYKRLLQHYGRPSIRLCTIEAVLLDRTHVAAAQHFALAVGVACPPELLPWYSRNRWQPARETVCALRRQKNKRLGIFARTGGTV